MIRIEKDKHESGDSRSTGHHNKTDHTSGRDAKNRTREDDTDLARLTVLSSQLLPIIQSLQGFQWPRPQGGDPEGRDKSRYCKYHKDVGHQTNDC